MFTYSDNTNKSEFLCFYCFNLIEISFIPVPDDSGDPDERFACRRSQRSLLTKHPNLHHVEQWLICVVFAGARNHCKGSVGFRVQYSKQKVISLSPYCFKVSRSKRPTCFSPPRSINGKPTCDGPASHPGRVILQVASCYVN
jgi:hypothetical protein